ncbi:hypothetical protein ACTWPF_08740 [Oceanobacillus sp. M65]|uniref:hypothetical protein n=1 Tax=Oceanobacillus sp. M65 TaxID=3457435 RepID=UPI003FCE87E0
MTEIIDFLSNIFSKIMEYIVVVFFWLTDLLANLLVLTGIVDKESNATVVAIIIMVIILLIILTTIFGSKYKAYRS